MAEETNQAENQAAPVYVAEAPREMIDAGVFYGRAKSKTNPKMRPFIFGTRGGVEIINLQKTTDHMEKAVAFIMESVRNGKDLALFVGTEPAAEGAIVALAKKFALPYVSNRWIGGTLTNFSIIAGRIEYLKKTRSGLASGEFDKYTKKERLELDREVRRLETLMGGLEELPREPDFLVIVNPVLHDTAVAEARRRKIPVIAFANVDANPDTIDYLIPGNDKAKMSISWFLEKIEKAIEEGRKMQMAAKAAATAEAATKA
jgi:small subunit ribosomal protein S2